MSGRMQFVLALALSALVFPSAASSQAFPLRFGIGGGPSFPTGHFSEEAGTGYHLQGSLAFAVPVLPVALRADLLWQQFPDEHEGSFREIGGLVNAKVNLPLPLARPYAIGGVGLINHNPPDAQHGGHVHAGEDKTSFAFNLGAGLQVRLARLNAFLEARYLHAGEDHRAIPITFGLMF